eukprot:TRINITY_DN10851_c0_g1_i2.p1 TRINITY_DN10851_c0_g1~~TRINITY_DN10851_c0_g1_i2.p1  ORF type:complete len:101 (-),score=13.72 TRINITY_DN10851_c0_g1_i2:65-367(-)
MGWVPQSKQDKQNSSETQNTRQNTSTAQTITDNSFQDLSHAAASVAEALSHLLGTLNQTVEEQRTVLIQRHVTVTRINGLESEMRSGRLNRSGYEPTKSD